MLYDFLDTVTRHLSDRRRLVDQELLRLVVSMRSFRSTGLTYLTMPVAGFGSERGQSVVYADRPCRPRPVGRGDRRRGRRLGGAAPAPAHPGRRQLTPCSRTNATIRSASSGRQTIRSGR